jgi:MFS family permease
MTVAVTMVDTTRGAAGNYRWYALAILTLAQLCHAMDRSIIALVLEPIGKEYALSDGQLGLLAGLAYGLAFAVAAIPFGIAVDRVQRRVLLAAAIAVWSGFTALCGMANSYATLLLSRAAVGAAEAGATPTGLSLLGDYFRVSERATAVGIWYMSAGLGATAAFLGGGYVVQHYGWREAFFVAGAPGLAIAALVFFTLREPPRGDCNPAMAAAPKRDFRASIKLIIAQPGLVHCMAGIMLVAISMSGLASWLVSFLVRVHGLSIAQGGTVVAFSLGVLGAAGGVVAGFVVDRIGRRRARYDPRLPATAAAITCVATAVLAAGAISVPSTPLAIALLLAAGLLITAYNGPANSLLLTLAPTQIRGLTVSIVQFGCNLVGMGIGPLIVGMVSQTVGGQGGLRWGLLAVLFFNLWGAAHFLLVTRRFGRRPV